MRAMMSGVMAAPEEVRTATVTMGGVPKLVGVGYLDHIGWYNVTVMDLGTIIERDVFLPVAIGALVLLIVVALVLSWIFRLVVLARLENVEAGLVAVQQGKRASMVPDRSNDEIGRLSRTLILMWDAITDGRLSL